MNWKYNTPSFEYEVSYLDNHMPWAGHKHFAYDIVYQHEFKCIVELGTHKGTSLFAFAQALKDKKDYDCKLIGIDSWEGDLNTGPYEGDKIYDDVKTIIKKHYPQQNIELKRCYFEEALKTIPNHTVDLLHIDGLHTYEAVKNDYETWKEKLTNNAVILFHDIIVEKENFGVKQFWSEIKNKFSFTLSFPHSNGLGVAFVSEPAIKISDKDKLYIHYLNQAYISIKYHLYLAKNDQVELNFIRNSKWWKVKELGKKIIRRS